ncbi:MAG: hypothetical protein AAGK05_16825 [Pseudomonadota bacterium]
MMDFNLLLLLLLILLLLLLSNTPGKPFQFSTQQRTGHALRGREPQVEPCSKKKEQFNSIA